LENYDPTEERPRPGKSSPQGLSSNILTIMRI
jgi:hypothetical protein